MAGVALLSEVDHLYDGGCDNMYTEGRSGTMWSKASTVATATGVAARQSADAAKGRLEVVRPIVREKASKAAVVAGTAARHGMEVATEGLDAMRQSCPVMREKVSTAAVAAGSVARHHVEVAKDQLDSVRHSRPGVAAKQRLEVAKGHLDAVRNSGPVIAARHGVDAAKERVDAAKDFIVSVRYPGLAPGQSINACDPVDDSGRLIAMAFARHHLIGMEAEDSEAAADFLRSQRKPPTLAGAAQLRVKASFKKVRSSLRSTKRRMTSFIKKAKMSKQSRKQRAAQRAAANENSSQRLLRSNSFNTPTTEVEEDVAPPDVFELFSNEELALQQALTESVESAEWGATPDGRLPTAVDFFPVTASTVPLSSDVVAPETGDEQFDVLAPDAGDEQSDVLAPDAGDERSDMLAPDAGDEQFDVLASSAGDEHLVQRAWFLQPSAGTWLLPVPYTKQDVSSTPSIDNVVEEVSSSEAVSSPEVHTSKIATPTRANLVQLTSCGGA